ncbi:MAG TPA: hypothetical protein VFJ16_30505 [Longimicrobium sp.]|nr:hypothetical protein [Longimicrobium sp.]
MPAPSRILRHLALALPLIAALGACSTWSGRPVTTQPQRQFLTGPVRVTLTTREAVVLDGVAISSDSVTGREHARPHARVAIPVSVVRRVEARGTDPLRTSGAVILALGAAVAVCAAFLMHTDAVGY